MKQSLLLLSLALAGCVENPDQGASPASDLSIVESEVESAVWSFHAADTSRNAEAVVDLLWPEFYMLADGNRTEYDEVIAGTRTFFESLDHFGSEWTDLRITVLDPEHAVASFRFRDSIVTKAGQLVQSQGPTTLIWEQRDGKWGILYADADHYGAP